MLLAVSLAVAQQAIVYTTPITKLLTLKSKCFDSQFEAAYGADNLPQLTFGINLFVDPRLFAEATLQGVRGSIFVCVHAPLTATTPRNQTDFQPAIDLANEFFKGAKIRFGDVKMLKLVRVSPACCARLFFADVCAARARRRRRRRRRQTQWRRCLTNVSSQRCCLACSSKRTPKRLAGVST